MSKPKTHNGYNGLVTENCERVLVTLLRGLGPWKDSIYLVGGLTPRYLVRERPPKVPAHAGTGDIDIVVGLQMLAEIEAYHSLEENLKRMGFAQGTNSKGNTVKWRWRRNIDESATVILEFLADDPKHRGGKVTPLPTEGEISALNIPHSSMVFEHYEEVEISAELLDNDGFATEKIRYANLVSFSVLKALAFDQRFERKDAHDLVYCIEHAEGGVEQAAKVIRECLNGKHSEVVRRALSILSSRFADDDKTEGYRKDGPIAVAKFELGEEEDSAEARALRQRDVSALFNKLLSAIAKS